jgi:hypothetical protein
MPTAARRERPLTSVGLPEERAAQLDAIAAAQGLLGKGEAVEYLLNLAIERKIIPDRLPGFSAISLGESVLVSVKALALPVLSRNEACIVAALFSAAAGGGGKALNVGSGVAISVKRRGRGVVVIVADQSTGEGVRGSMTPAMARDFSRQIRKAAGLA